MKRPNSYNRAAPVPTEEEARLGLSSDLARGDMDRAGRLATLPLMDVALNGYCGMQLAAGKAKRRAA